MEEQANYLVTTFQLLLANVHSNPSSANMEHPCVACLLEAKALGIQCDSCNRCCHPRCAHKETGVWAPKVVVVTHGCPLGAVCCPYQAACSSCRSTTMNERGDSVVNCGNHPNSLRQGGGVMFLTRSNIPAIQRHDLDSNCELLWVELILPAMKILGVLYCPPSSPSSQFSLL